VTESYLQEPECVVRKS